MEHLDDILKLADVELRSIIANGKFRSREEVDTVYKLVDVIKDVYCIEDMEEEEYSGNYGMSNRSYRGNDGSYARGRRKRDSMGRYSRDGSYRYSRDAKDEYIEQLHELMDSAPDDRTRQSIQRMIQEAQE